MRFKLIHHRRAPFVRCRDRVGVGRRRHRTVQYSLRVHSAVQENFVRRTAVRRQRRRILTQSEISMKPIRCAPVMSRVLGANVKGTNSYSLFLHDYFFNIS